MISKVIKYFHITKR